MFEEILRELGTERKAGKVLLPLTRQAVPLDTKNFSRITPISGPVTFVDGGNGPLFESPDTRVEMVRLYACVFDGIKRVSRHRKEGILLIQRRDKNITVKGFHGLEFSTIIPLDDPELRMGQEEITLGTVAGLARFMLECRFALEYSKGLLVRDGALLGANKHEDAVLRELLASGAPVAGLSKTNSLATDAGGSAAASLMTLGPEGKWVYDMGVVEGIKLSVVKLHESSRYVFRLDTTQAEDAAALLAATSIDPAFLGYPYPLVEADRMARVSQQETPLYRARLMAEAGEQWKALALLEKGKDAHSVLDRLG